MVPIHPKELAYRDASSRTRCVHWPRSRSYIGSYIDLEHLTPQMLDGMDTQQSVVDYTCTLYCQGFVWYTQGMREQLVLDIFPGELYCIGGTNSLRGYNLTEQLPSGVVPLRVFLECVCAAHLSAYVDAPVEDRGGLMVIGSPGVLKSTLLGFLDRNYADALAVSDINARNLVELRDQIAGGIIRTLILPEMFKLYERHASTSANVEGTLRALAAEGFHASSNQDQQIQRTVARCMVIGGMTPMLLELNSRRWRDSGFSRRFLWSLIALENPQALTRSVIDWTPVNIGLPDALPPVPGSKIPSSTVTRAEREKLEMQVKYQQGAPHNLQHLLLCKMLVVLRWWYRMHERRADPDKESWQTILLFARTLGKSGAYIRVELPRTDSERRTLVRKGAK